MSRELFKSMTYKDGKVYTRQCSNNVYPKDYYSEENSGLTKIYSKLGQINFEKWFITNGLMTGNIEILSSSNKILKRLDYVANLLWEDKGFRELKDKEYEIFMKSLSAKTENDKEITNKESIMIKGNIEKYVSSFYDTHSPRFKEKERER